MFDFFKQKKQERKKITELNSKIKQQNTNSKKTTLGFAPNISHTEILKSN